MLKCFKLRLVAVIAALILCTGTALAQDLPGIDMQRWSDLANRAEASVDEGNLDEGLLETYRNGLAAYRDQFELARSTNASRINSLRDQLSMLGTPIDGLPEADEVAFQRRELEEQLAVLNAPVMVADTAFARTNGLISEIDMLLRARKTDALIKRVGSPLIPANWPPALVIFKAALAQLWNEAGPEGASERRAEFMANLQVIVVAGLAGLLLILMGQRWSKKIVARFNRQSDGSGANVWRFVLSLLRIVFPLIGLALLSFAMFTTGYLGEKGEQRVVVIPLFGGLMLCFRWVADQVFSRNDEDALILLRQQERAQARLMICGITLFFIASILVVHILEMDGADVSVVAIVSFPLTILTSYCLYRTGQVLRCCGSETAELEDDEITRASTLARMVRSLGALSISVAIAATVSHAFGFYNASSFILLPTILTLVTLGLVLTLQRFSADVYGAISGTGKLARESLYPIFFGLILLMLAVPLLAFVWGARVADITEVWAAFRRGFSVGNSRVSPTDFIYFAVIFSIGYVATRLAQGALKTNVLPKTKIDKGGQNAIVSGLGYVGIFLAALVAIMGAGIDLSSLAIVAGALSVGIGFGLQNIVSNFVSGIILLVERPISEGDWIEVGGGQMGYVRDISVRSTRIETFDKTDVIVPNADLISGTVTNYTRGNTLGRVIVPIGVAYGSDTRKVEAILREIAEAQPMVLANPAPAILFMNFGPSSLDFEIRMFLRDVNWSVAVKNDVNHAIAERFAQEGVEIPFPQQDVWLRTAPKPMPHEENHQTDEPAGRGIVQRADGYLTMDASEDDDDGDDNGDKSDSPIDGDGGA